jgi:hypothetical protein
MKYIKKQALTLMQQAQEAMKKIANTVSGKVRHELP